MQIRIQVEVLRHRQIFIQPKPLRHVADPVLDLLRILATSMPSTSSCPLSARNSPAASRIKVVLPAPSGPTSAVSMPRGASSDTPSSACTGGSFFGVKRLCTSRAKRTAWSIIDPPLQAESLVSSLTVAGIPNRN